MHNLITSPITNEMIHLEESRIITSVLMKVKTVLLVANLVYYCKVLDCI